MRLGSSIIGGKPMRIPGIVDVYQVGDQWIARSWPKPANQPNSPAQLLWRQKFADAHACVSGFAGTYLEKWKQIECPPGKMWIDVAIHSFLKLPLPFARAPMVPGCKFGCYYSPSGFVEFGHLFPETYAWYFNWNALQWLMQPYSIQLLRSSTWKDVMKWNDDGWICAKGKRPKKRWILATTHDWAWYSDWVAPIINGQQCWAFYSYEWPTGVTLLRLNHFPHYMEYNADYALTCPPVFCPVEPWPGGFTP